MILEVLWGCEEVVLTSAHHPLEAFLLKRLRDGRSMHRAPIVLDGHNTNLNPTEVRVLYDQSLAALRI